MILTPDYHFYSRVAFNNEAEIERIVLDNFKKIFGDYALLLPKTKISTLGGTGTIPDGIVVDFEDEEWSIIEVELAGHGTWQHIAPQISKQLTATITDSAQAKIVDLCLTMIGSDSEFQDSLEELGIHPIDIHGKLNAILAKKPIVALPIDDIPSDLDQWAQTLTYTVKLWKVEKYIQVWTQKPTEDSVRRDRQEGRHRSRRPGLLAQHRRDPMHQQGKSSQDDGEWMDDVENPEWEADYRAAEEGASISVAYASSINRNYCRL